MIKAMHSPPVVKPMFTPLHVKSAYSLGYGTASIQELLECAVAQGYCSLALTDLENLYGQVHFHHQCRLHGIHAITGIELRQGFDGRGKPGDKKGRVVLLACDEAGYRSLCRIVSRRRGTANRRVHGPLPDPLPLVMEHAEGLFALSDDAQVMEQLLASGTYPLERLGLLMVRPNGKKAGVSKADGESAVEAAARLGIRLTADLDSVFLQASDHPLHLLQVAIAKGETMASAATGAGVETSERWLWPTAEVAALFADTPDALLATSEIAEACRFELGAGDETAHVFNPRASALDAEKLRRLCHEAQAEMQKVKRDWSKEHDRRLKEELAVLSSLHFSGFMLMVAEILSHCRNLGIPVAVRGSAVSSLVLHVLGGSPVDPLAYGLLFERFLHPGKTAWPDVDLDLPWHRRDEVIGWVYERFGADKVAMVAAHHSFRYRSALREGLKAWGAPDSLIESMSRAIPAEDLTAEDADSPDLAASPDHTNSTPLFPPALYRENKGLDVILPLIRRLVGRPRHVAVHPGGIVIDWRPLEDLLPLELAPKGVVITQYDLVAVAKLGLVKIDLLGNRCLSEIEESLTLAGWKGPLRLDSIPAEDPPTLELIDRAQTVGCFQLESPAMRSLLARLPIRRQSDLIAALALIRPGAASGEVKSTFVRRARGEERTRIDFPVLADRLNETYGLPIYEEDIMVLLSRTGGVDLAQADELRRGIVKSGGDPVALSVLQGEFLGRAKARYPNDDAALARARRAWLIAARFAAYSFNKAHAASYALLAYYSAFTKTHYPLPFACALLNHHQGLYPLRIEASELARMGVQLLGPRVNASERLSVVEEGEGSPAAGAVRVGLDKIKGLSQRTAVAIIAQRDSGGKFTSLRDLFERVRLASHEVAALVLCGACDDLPPLSTADYPFVHEAVLDRLRQPFDPADLDRFPYARPESTAGADDKAFELYQALVRVRNELNYLEMHLSAHPLALMRQEAALYGCLTIREVVGAKADSTLRLVAVIAAMRRIATGQGPMQFLTLEDETGLLEAVVHPSAYRGLGERVTTPGPFLVEGKLRLQQDAAHLEVSRLDPFHERKRAYGG
jgi:DNA polymerase-3 subunit alpha